MAEDAQAAPSHEGRWRYSTMETFYPDDRTSLEEPCEVVVTAEGLRLSHHDEEHGRVLFVGERRGPGHFVVRAAHGASGSLHAFSDGRRLEGYWIDRGWRGMWTITLSDDSEDG